MTIIATIETVSWAVIKLPTPPTKPWYIFDWWEGLPTDGKSIGEDLNITVKWKANTNNTNTGWWWGGGWGGSSSSSSSSSSSNSSNVNDLNKNENKEHNSADLTWANLSWNNVKTEADMNSEKEAKTSENKKQNNNWNQTRSGSWVSDVYITEKYTKEVLDAYTWAYSKDITTMSTIEKANPEWWLIRQHMAKMVVNYAVNVLWREIPEKTPRNCLWKDGPNSFESQEMVDYALKACKLWLMWIDMDYFQPNLQVTRAQFGTILSRLLYGTKYAWWTPYYKKHLNALKSEGIMTQIENPENRIELREWVWVMLMRVKDFKVK